MLYADLPEATLIYLNGICLEDQEIEIMIEQLKRFAKKARIVTVSYPLSEYAVKGFKVEKVFPLSFPFGITEAYLQTMIEE